MLWSAVTIPDGEADFAHEAGGLDGDGGVVVAPARLGDDQHPAANVVGAHRGHREEPMKAYDVNRARRPRS